MNGNLAEAVLDSFSRQMKHMPSTLRKSMPVDPKLRANLNGPGALTSIWSCDRHAPCQRGLIENINDLMCQFMPKGTDFFDASQTWSNDVARLTNERQRKTLRWEIPAEAVAEENQVYSSPIALDPWIHPYREIRTNSYFRLRIKLFLFQDSSVL